MWKKKPHTPKCVSAGRNYIIYIIKRKPFKLKIKRWWSGKVSFCPSTSLPHLWMLGFLPRLCASAVAGMSSSWIYGVFGCFFPVGSHWRTNECELNLDPHRTFCIACCTFVWNADRETNLFRYWRTIRAYLTLSKKNFSSNAFQWNNENISVSCSTSKLIEQDFSAMMWPLQCFKVLVLCPSASSMFLLWLVVFLHKPQKRTFI